MILNQKTNTMGKLSKSELKEFKEQEQSKKELEARYGNIEVNLEDGTFKLITDEKNK